VGAPLPDTGAPDLAVRGRGKRGCATVASRASRGRAPRPHPPDVTAEAEAAEPLWGSLSKSLGGSLVRGDLCARRSRDFAHIGGQRDGRMSGSLGPLARGLRRKPPGAGAPSRAGEGAPSRAGERIAGSEMSGCAPGRCSSGRLARADLSDGSHAPPPHLPRLEIDYRSDAGAAGRPADRVAHGALESLPTDSFRRWWAAHDPLDVGLSADHDRRPFRQPRVPHMLRIRR
jgi:hypothetical protein